MKQDKRRSSSLPSAGQVLVVLVLAALLGFVTVGGCDKVSEMLGA